MRLIARCLQILLGGTILFAWLAVAVLWVRSHWRGDMIVYERTESILWPPPLTGSRTVLVISGDGGVCLGWRDMIALTGTWQSRSSSIQLNKLSTPQYPQPWMWGSRSAWAKRNGLASSAVAPSTMPAQFPLIPEMLAAPSSPFPAFGQFIWYRTYTQSPGSPRANDLTLVLILPYWSLMVMVTLLSLVPIAQIRNWRRKRRLVRERHCESCGYDLRATPDRCPECGTIPAMNVLTK